MSPDKLVHMANQIGTFFRSQGEDAVVDGTAEHIRKFWDPRMRDTISKHLNAGGAGLDPPVRRAIEKLRDLARTG
jgi:formate dehydrogenase subunit delta